MQKNQVFQGTVTGLTSEGLGVTHAQGMAVFLPAVCPGDEIEFSVVKALKSYAYGRLIRVITPSEDRVAPGCPAYPRCGGCVTRALSYPAELAVKKRNAEENFRKLGGLEVEAETVLSAEPDRYRNKAIFPVAEENGRLAAGFYAPRSHRVIPVSDCRLQPADFAPLVNTILAFGTKQGWKPYDRAGKTGDIRHIFLRKGFATGEILVTLIVSHFHLKGIKILADRLVGSHLAVGLTLCENRRNDNVLLTDSFRLIAGKGSLTDRLCGLTFEVAPRSFYQVNPVMAARLYRAAEEFLEPKPDETLLDLYCGAGTIGLSMARKFKQIIGVEIIPQAVENARENARRNQIENAEFFCSDAGTAAAELAEKGLHPDAAVIDPPRKGCDRPCLDALLAMAPEKIAMISCNSATAARDAAYLTAGGYRLTRCLVADLFPRTAHAECAALLVRA